MARRPVCKTQADLIRYEGVPIYTCGTCGGHWLTSSKLNAIVARREIVMPEAVQQKMLEIAAASNSRQPLWCLICGREMVKEAFRGWNEIQPDRCTKCGGVWLDRGELEKCQIYWEYAVDHPEMLGADQRARKTELDARWRLQQARVREAADEAEGTTRGAVGPIGDLGRMITDLFT